MILICRNLEKSHENRNYIQSLGDTIHSLSKFRYKQHGKKVVILISNKKKILEQLDRYSINRASLFPEIECVSDYIKNKYS